MRRRSTDVWRCVDSPRALVGLVGGSYGHYVDRYKCPVKRVQSTCKEGDNKKARAKAGFSDTELITSAVPVSLELQASA